MNKLYSYFLLLLLVPALQAKKSSYFSYNEKKNGVILDVQELSPKKAYKELGSGFYGRRTPLSVIPLKCTVTNTSGRTIRWYKDDIGLNFLSPDLIRKKADGSTAVLPKVAGTLSGLVFGGVLCMLSPLLIALAMADGVTVFHFVAIGAIVAITAVPVAVSDHYGRKTEELIEKKIIRPYESLGTIELKPGESVEFNLYTRKKALAAPFSMTVHDVDSQHVGSQHVGSQQKTQFMVAA